MISSKRVLPHIQTSLVMFAVLMQTVLAGCVTFDKRFSAPLAEPGGDSQQTARLSCFLTLNEGESQAIKMEISEIMILAGDLWLPIASGPIQIDSAEIGGGQLFLGGKAVQPGIHQKLRMTISKGELQNAYGTYETITENPLLVEMNLPTAMDLAAGDSRSIHVIWDVRNSLQDDNTFQPVLNVIQPGRQLPVNLVFVSCPEIDTIFIIRADKNWVVDSFGLKGRPTYLAIGPDSTQQRLYVLTTQERMVKAVDLSVYRVIDYFPVPLNDSPTFMTISPDGESAFLLDEKSGYISRMDLNTGQIVARTFLSHRPQFAAYLANQNLLAVSLSLARRVLLLDPENLNVLRSISVGNTPVGLASSENQLYIAESGDNTVLVHDLASGANPARINVGFGPRKIVQADDHIFVSNYMDGSLSVLAPGEFGSIHDIYGPGRPDEMAFNQFYHRLYVTDGEWAGLSVINATSNRLMGYIPLGAKAFGLSVIQ
jgi:DNA-binding beta-propeller fold protein YncE